MIFSSGYLASIGVLQGIFNSETIILADKHIHASWIDASFTVRARIIRYHHDDINHLDELLLKYSIKSKRLIILTETVFSMQGTVIDLQKYVNVAQKFGAILDLIPLCDEICKLKSLCSLCKNGTAAIHSMRLTSETEQTVVGSDNYIPTCRNCYETKRKV